MRAEALFVVFVFFVDVRGAPLKDLIDALNTTRPIWLYKQSYEHSPEAVGRTCVYWNKKDLSSSSYVFDYTFKQKGHYHTDQKTQAELSNMSGAGIMDVTYKREKVEPTQVYYTLDKWSPNEKCFILTRNVNGYYACDLYVWDENAKPGAHGTCDARYKEICGEGPTVFSEDECK
uniref:Putative group i salivary lipocalin n=1 Tax=Rhipicephalus pulchellus TaxID=72859 RepID=L7LTC8_RHIPC